MAIHLRLLRWVITAAIALALLLPLPLTALAADLPLDSDIEQSAIMVSPKADAPIAIALRPAPNQPSVGYGVGGQTVTVLEQVGDYLAFDDPSATWCHIRLDEKPYTEGWVQGKFLSISTTAKSKD